MIALWELKNTGKAGGRLVSQCGAALPERGIANCSCMGWRGTLSLIRSPCIDDTGISTRQDINIRPSSCICVQEGKGVCFYSSLELPLLLQTLV